MFERMGKVGAAEAMEEVRGEEGEAGRREAVTALAVTMDYGVELTEEIEGVWVVEMMGLGWEERSRARDKAKVRARSRARDRERVRERVRERERERERGKAKERQWAEG